MKKSLLFICLLALTVGLLGCSSQPQPQAPASTPEVSVTPPSSEAKTVLPADLEQTEFSFSSGVGGWRTQLTLHADGTFTGDYTDYDSDETYLSEFSGKFVDIREIDENTYRLTLDTLTYQKQPDTEWEEDGIRYIAAEANGISGGKEFTLCKPGTSLASLPEELSDWYRGNGDTLECYALFDPTLPSYFFGG